MASQDLVSRRKRKRPQLRDSDWLPHKDLVYMRYLVEDRELGEVLEELYSRGLDVKCVPNHVLPMAVTLRADPQPQQGRPRTQVQELGIPQDASI